MTPAEKAKELFEKFKIAVTGADQYGDVEDHRINEATRDAVLLAIVEVISACEFNHVEHWNTDWWEKVKEMVTKI